MGGIRNVGNLRMMQTMCSLRKCFAASGKARHAAASRLAMLWMHETATGADACLIRCDGHQGKARRLFKAERAGHSGQQLVRDAHVPGIGPCTVRTAQSLCGDVACKRHWIERRSACVRAGSKVGKPIEVGRRSAVQIEGAVGRLDLDHNEVRR